MPWRPLELLLRRSEGLGGIPGMTVLVKDRNYHFGKSWFTILFFDLIRTWVARGDAGRACDMSTTTALA
ncbi:hypothetical protein NG827_08135 [Xanthomonas sacchari]|uniref:Uncharacterized protein n=1 Tax=Xanthomonas sontii TaxID=2650745 RepID=A0A6N7Q2V9_9XANT|nr:MULTISPECIES: hypothetical protein [Xanthomonas]MRG98782.1 hypothetical protein [Xanthomonas sontii]MRH73427.1 hypothetical protein [Xanthomonas sontii]UYK86355.1 hypothetical protein NG827_08135 [Xanthomonas sacchari]